MRLILTTFSLLCAGFLFAQTADVTKGCAPLEVKFTPPAGATGFFWDFKDGGSSNLQSPSNIFTNPGTYNVEFKNSPNGAVVGTIQITVFPKPELMITANPESGCRPLNVQFTNTTMLPGDVTVSNYFWVFGDGGSQSGASANVSHLYLPAGTFTVSLEITTNYSTCNVTEIFADKIKTSNKPVVAFITNPAPPAACDPPLNVTFTNTTVNPSGLTFLWDLGNGQTSTAVNPPQQTYTTNGNFPIKLTATDAIGCSATANGVVTIGSPVADFAVDDTVCFDSPVQFNAMGAGSYSWNFGPNATPPISNQPNPIVHFKGTPGNQTITLTVTATGGCTSTVSKTVFVDRPNANFSATPVYSCSDPTTFNFNATAPGTASWEWTFSDGSTSNIKSPTYVWNNPDPLGYTLNGRFLDSVQLIVSNPSGCRDTLIRVDTIWLPNARFMPDKYHGCAPLTVMFSDSSTSNEQIVQWEWIWDDGTPNTLANNGNNQSHTFSSPGEYDVTLVIRNTKGCRDTSYIIRIEVGEPISGTFTVDKTSVCPGDSVHFTNTTNNPNIDGWHFSSESDQQWHCYQNQNPAWAYTTETGNLDVSLTVDYNGCYHTITQQDVIEVKGPIAKLKYATTCDSSYHFEFTDMSSGATSVKWYFGDGDSSIVANPSHNYLLSGEYQVILKAENPSTGCPVSCDTAFVYPTFLKSKFEIDSFQCGGSPLSLDASESVDVNGVCHKGYTWYFSFQRPIRTDTVITDIIIPDTGWHYIALATEDINGCRDTLHVDFRAFPVRPMFKVSDDLICNPTTVQFTDMSVADTTIVSWEWDFGDGTTSTEQNPSHTFNTFPPIGSSFPIKLKITNALGCPQEINYDLQFYAPRAVITAIPTNICVGQEVIFAATDYNNNQPPTPTTWQWNFQDGTPTVSGQTVSHTFNTAGLFSVTLNYAEISTGCPGEATQLIDVQAYPDPMFTTNADNDPIICHPKNMTFTNTSTPAGGLSAFWDLGNGVTAAGPTASTVYPKGNYTATLVVTTSNGCSATVSRNFTVVGPEGTFKMDKNFICVGDEITFTLNNDTADVSTWQWNFGDGTTMDGGSPVKHKYDFLPPSGMTIAQLVLKGGNDACQFAVPLPVNFSLVNADFTVSSPAVCLGVPHSFINTSTDADVSKWLFSDGGTSNLTNASHEFPAEGTHTVTLIVTDNPLGCMDTLTQTVSVTGIPNFQLFGDVICKGDEGLIGLTTPIDQGNFTWSPANLIVGSANNDTVRVKPTVTTTFSVSVTDGQGCMDEAQVEVVVPNGFDGGMSLDTFVEKGATVNLPLEFDPNFNYSWSPTSPSGTGPWTVTPTDSSLHFMVTVTDLEGCEEDIFEYHIRVAPDDLWAPNAFTPANGDTINNVFRLIPNGEWGLIEITELKIYNRWGSVVFEGSGLDSSTTVRWDGTVDDKDAPSDVYVWYAKAKFKTGREASFKGELTLIR